MHPCRVLFICTGNAARSILSEATLNHLGKGRFVAYSAGSKPTGRVNPHALEELARAGTPIEGLSSKSWDRFAGEQAPPLDIAVTVCDSAASEPCPLLFGDFVRTHWGLPDPAATRGSPVAIREAFRQAHIVITRRIMALIDLPVEALDSGELKRALDGIGAVTGDDNGEDDE